MLALRDYEDAPYALDDDAITDDVIVDIASPDILAHVVGESDFVAHHFLFIFFRDLSHFPMMYLPFHLWI